MALLDSILSTENVSPAKINDCIQVVNSALGVGTTGQRLVKNSGNDFDTTWANPENIAKYTGSSFSLESKAIGDAVNFITTQSTYVGNANQLVKIYSLATPTKYLIALLESGTTSTNLTGRIQYNSDDADTTLISDWLIVPYNYELSVFNSDIQTSFVANQLFSALSLTNCTLSEYNINASKQSNKVSLSGFVTIEATGTNPIVRFSLTDKYLILNGNVYDFYFGSNCILQASGVSSSATSICSNLSVGSSSESLLSFRTLNTIASGNVLTFYFTLDYIAKNYSI